MPYEMQALLPDYRKNLATNASSQLSDLLKGIQPTTMSYDQFVQQKLPAMQQSFQQTALPQMLNKTVPSGTVNSGALNRSVAQYMQNASQNLAGNYMDYQQNQQKNQLDLAELLQKIQGQGDVLAEEKGGGFKRFFKSMFSKDVGKTTGKLAAYAAISALMKKYIGSGLDSSNSQKDSNGNPVYVPNSNTPQTTFSATF